MPVCSHASDWHWHGYSRWSQPQYEPTTDSELAAWVVVSEIIERLKLPEDLRGCTVSMPDFADGENVRALLPRPQLGFPSHRERAPGSRGSQPRRKGQQVGNDSKRNRWSRNRDNPACLSGSPLLRHGQATPGLNPRVAIECSRRIAFARYTSVDAAPTPPPLPCTRGGVGRFHRCRPFRPPHYRGCDPGLLPGL
jgi:hypothetical protein